MSTAQHRTTTRVSPARPHSLLFATLQPVQAAPASTIAMLIPGQDKAYCTCMTVRWPFPQVKDRRPLLTPEVCVMAEDIAEADLRWQPVHMTTFPVIHAQT